MTKKSKNSNSVDTKKTVSPQSEKIKDSTNQTQKKSKTDEPKDSPQGVIYDL